MNNLCKNILSDKAGSLQTGIDGSIAPDFATVTIVICHLHGDDDPELDGLGDYLMGEDSDQELLGKAVTAKKKKGFFKKIGEAVKKGGKLFVRFNPLTISARGGFLLAMKLNVKKMASKLKWGYPTKEDAAKKGITAQQWKKSKKALDKIENLFHLHLPHHQRRQLPGQARFCS